MCLYMCWRTVKLNVKCFENNKKKEQKHWDNDAVYHVKCAIFYFILMEVVFPTFQIAHLCIPLPLFVQCVHLADPNLRLIRLLLLFLTTGLVINNIGYMDMSMSEYFSCTAAVLPLQWFAEFSLCGRNALCWFSLSCLFKLIFTIVIYVNIRLS